MTILKRYWLALVRFSLMAAAFLAAPVAWAVEECSKKERAEKIKCLLDQAGQSGFGQTSKTPGLSIGGLIGGYVTIFLGFVGTIAFVVFLYGGFLWLTARGNEEQVEQAKKYLFNGTVGIIVIVLAYSAAYFITNQVFQASKLST